jgi:hypothetical protein
MLVSVLARTRRFFARAAAGCPVARFRADRAAEVARLGFAALEFRVLLLDFLRVAIVTLSTRDRVLHAACRTVAPPFFRAAQKPPRRQSGALRLRNWRASLQALSC